MEIWNKGYTARDLQGFEIICWPFSQYLMNGTDYQNFCKLINDEEGLKKFGSSAFVVDLRWLKENIENLEHKL